MARLNEPALPVESIESLKRKFMRQNRDIARVNSTQSLRIRSLENEVARLLTENLSLRGEIARCQSELENNQAQRMVDHNTALKAQLDEKLHELSALINGLGQLPNAKKQSPKRRILSIVPGSSPNIRRRRSDNVADDEGRLPAILENKSYPRKTLDHQEIQGLVASTNLNSSDSPEIGPPPISQFVNEDPVKFDLPIREAQKTSEEHGGLDTSISINLEQRKKRKDSIGPSDARRVSGRPDTTTSTRGISGSLKTGAKRKLSVRDDEDRETATRPTESPDDFKFTRVAQDEKSKSKLNTSNEKTGSKGTREAAVVRGSIADKQPGPALQTTRKVLAPKSVNNSPRKASNVQLLDESKPSKPDILKPKPLVVHKDRQEEAILVEPPTVLPLDTIEVQSYPETPAGVDLFSPPSSQALSNRPESRDTPPPSDLGPGMEGQRPSRRARGAVSYAEPNLRDKMRRPTKELVDAVARDGKGHRSSLVKNEEGHVETGVKIKAETDAEESWKHMPVASSSTVENSPLRGKISVPESLPSSITTHRKRRESLLHQSEPENQHLSSGTAIAALLAENRKIKAKVKEIEKERGGSSDKSSAAMLKPEGAEIDSTMSVKGASSRASTEERTSSRNLKRNSTLTPDIPCADDSEASDMESSKKFEGTSRRRQSTLGLRSSSNDSLSKDTVHEKVLKRAASTIVVPDLSAAARSERVSARRKSMML